MIKYGSSNGRWCGVDVGLKEGERRERRIVVVLVGWMVMAVVAEKFVGKGGGGRDRL